MISRLLFFHIGHMLIDVFKGNTVQLQTKIENQIPQKRQSFTIQFNNKKTYFYTRQIYTYLKTWRDTFDIL